MGLLRSGKCAMEALGSFGVGGMSGFGGVENS
jgi:hypothetical protein